MRKDLIRISTANMSREDWLAVRRGSIGGSDAAGILGMNPYSSQYAVWTDKLALRPEQPENEAMRQGRDFEDYVARRFMEKTGKRVRRDTAVLYNPDYPFAHANIDRRIVGEDAGLECKTTTVLNLKRFKNGDYPATYYVQCMHYMAVTGAARWYLGVLVLGQDFFDFVIERDEEEIAELMEQEAAFWKLVANKTPPGADGLPATTEALSEVYSESQNGCVNLFGRDSLLLEYKQLQKDQKALEGRLECIKQTLMQDLGEADRGLCGAFAVSWAAQTRRSFDAKRFFTDHPEMDAESYWKESQFRRFSIREVK